VDRHSNDTLVPAQEQFRGRYPAYLLEAVDWATQMEPDRRPQDAGELLEVFRRNLDAGAAPGLRLSEPLTETRGAGAEASTRSQTGSDTRSG